jgi:hypothetical protein
VNRALVEQFFRHEFGRLVTVLTRSLRVRRLDFVEDVVQAALENRPLKPGFAAACLKTRPALPHRPQPEKKRC